MKKWIILTLIAFLAPSLVTAQNLYRDALNTKRVSLKVVYLEENAFAYTDDTGKLTGVEIEIFNHFRNWIKSAKGITIDAEFVGIKDFNEFYNTVRDGDPNVIGLGTVTILERRKSELKFTEPFINNIALLVTHESIPTLSSLDNMSTAFAGLKGVAGKATTLETYLRNVSQRYHPNAELEFLPSQTEVVEFIAKNTTHYSYMDLSIYWPAKQRNLPVKRHPVGDLSSETFGFIVPLSSDWDVAMNQFFKIGAGYRSTTVYRKILMRHLGTEVTKMLELARLRTKN